ncbi:MAG: hypothetical protein H0V72_11605 [Bradyrhizobium sp.]|nr:hypothetical protein [Bradyrhizobium sp.]
MAQEFRTITQRVTLVNAAMRSRGLSFTVWAATALLLCVVQAPTTRADPASCLEKVSSYVAEVDQLLAKEKNWITPFHDLNKRYSEFRDCDTDALLEVVWRSRFFKQITYNPRAKQYIVELSSKDVEVGFAYDARSKRSNTLSAVWVNK